MLKRARILAMLKVPCLFMLVCAMATVSRCCKYWFLEKSRETAARVDHTTTPVTLCKMYVAVKSVHASPALMSLILATIDPLDTNAWIGCITFSVHAKNRLVLSPSLVLSSRLSDHDCRHDHSAAWMPAIHDGHLSHAVKTSERERKFTHRAGY